MSSITINANIAALNAQRRFADSTRSIQDSFTRLSSGLRINTAKDDASGLAIASALNTDGAVFSQGIRNFNDGVSLLRIAEGAVQELSSIVLRIEELATQAANGVLSNTQRRALDAEAQALRAEYGRIAQSSSFNGQMLLDGGLSSLKLQGGYGQDGGINVSLGAALPVYNVGDGTFTAANSYSAIAAGTNQNHLDTGDFNGDGVDDLVSSQYQSGGGLSVLLSNGNGTFKASISLAVSAHQPGPVRVGDVTGDGILDLLTGGYGVGTGILLFRGNGDGTFKSEVLLASTGASIPDIEIRDVNSDGIEDITFISWGSDTITTLIGLGGGSFKAGVSTAVTPGSSMSLTMGDVNGDSIEDAVIYNNGPGNASQVYLGTNTGSYNFTGVNYTSVAENLSLADLNGDGILDIYGNTFYTPKLFVAFGNGNGTFRAESSFAVGAGTMESVAVDTNGDGFLDLVSSSVTDGVVDVLLGNGNGTFKARTSFTAPSDFRSAALGDFNDDGVFDIATGAGGSVYLLLANANGSAGLPSFSLETRADALDAIETLAEARIEIGVELGNIGAIESRVSSALNALSISRENYLSASSQITDVDVAEETARLVRARILQQAGQAVLAQANQSLEIARLLLSP